MIYNWLCNSCIVNFKFFWRFFKWRYFEVKLEAIERVFTSKDSLLGKYRILNGNSDWYIGLVRIIRLLFPMAVFAFIALFPVLLIAIFDTNSLAKFASYFFVPYSDTWRFLFGTLGRFSADLWAQKYKRRPESRLLFMFFFKSV